MKIIAFPIESCDRELESRLQLAKELKGLNWKVIIGSKAEVRNIMRHLNGGAIMFKDFSQATYMANKDIFGSDIKVIALDEEALVQHDDKRYLTRLDKNFLNKASLLFLWGRDHERRVKNFIKLTEKIEKFDFSKLIVSGNPRIVNQPIDRVTQTIKDPGLKKEILINTAFPAGNWDPRQYGTSDYMNHQKLRGRVSSNDRRLFFEEKILYQKRLCRYFESLIKNLSKLFPHVKITIRPHPDESTDFWKIVSKSVVNKNVTCKREGDINAALDTASVVITNGCTTAIEALMKQKVTLVYDPEPLSKIHPPLIRKVSNTFTSEDIVLKEIGSYLSGIKPHAILGAEKKHLINTHIEEGDPVAKITDSINNLKINEISILRYRIVIFLMVFKHTINKIRVKLKLLQISQVGQRKVNCLGKSRLTTSKTTEVHNIMKTKKIGLWTFLLQ